MKNKLKVIHICDKFGVKGSSFHGISRLFSWWFPRFDTKHFEVKLVGLRGPDHASENLKKEGINVTCLDKGKFDFSTLTEIVRIVRKQRADIIHLHGYGASNFGRMAAKITKVKNIVHEHFVDPAMPMYQAPFDYFLARCTDLGIANCVSVKDFMVKQRCLPNSKVKVVFNGVPLTDFVPLNKDTVMLERKKWNIPEQYKIVASIGRLDEQKGNRYLIDAAKKILRRTRKIRFLIVGDGPLMSSLHDQCRNNGIEDHVVFTGYHSNIPLILSMTDIFVIPSLWEGTTLTVFEAMAMRKPIVSTNVDGLDEVLNHGQNALLVPKKDSDALARAIEALLLNQKKAATLASAAAIASHDYDIAKTVDELQTLYTSLFK